MRRTMTLLLTALVGSTLGVPGATAHAQTPATADLTLSAVALNVSDLARSEKFYIDLLGLERTFRYPAEGKPLEVGLSRPGQRHRSRRLSGRALSARGAAGPERQLSARERFRVLAICGLPPAD